MQYTRQHSLTDRTNKSNILTVQLLVRVVGLVVLCPAVWSHHVNITAEMCVHFQYITGSSGQCEGVRELIIHNTPPHFLTDQLSRL